MTHHQIAACLCVDWCIEVLPPLLGILFFFVHFLLMRASLIYSIKIKKRCSSVVFLHVSSAVLQSFKPREASEWFIPQGHRGGESSRDAIRWQRESERSENERKVYSQLGRQNTEENGLPHPRLGDKLEEKPSQSLLTWILHSYDSNPFHQCFRILGRRS